MSEGHNEWDCPYLRCSVADHRRVRTCFRLPKRVIYVHFACFEFIQCKQCFVFAKRPKVVCPGFFLRSLGKRRPVGVVEEGQTRGLNRVP
ncbi:hypothetical protein EVAR_89968_1 [Eumeta japonica]|uniref:Uncharacterized protein n=1 Tax=Eumeta variegata TaxID=151549 RepID=A0A4C2A806_EUMVA|nr:hypothetical protein EVAR_89968_1 [Eumeta japonica]